MSKFFLFALLFWLIGNPFIAIIVILVILYAIDRRFIGLLPSLVQPIRRMRRMARLKRELQQQPHNTSNKLELAHLHMERKQYAEALRQLEQVNDAYESADIVYGKGLSLLKLGQLEEGRRHIERSLEMNPRVKYGEPYLRLGEALAHHKPDEAASYLEQFREVQSSSCEGLYKLGRIYERLGQKEQAGRAYAEALDVYRGLPRYKRRAERRWALLSKLRGFFS